MIICCFTYLLLERFLRGLTAGGVEVTLKRDWTVPFVINLGWIFAALFFVPLSPRLILTTSLLCWISTVKRLLTNLSFVLNVCGVNTLTVLQSLILSGTPT